MIPTILKKLVFGDAAQIAALKALEDEKSWCDRCSGDGEIPCPDCNGTGKKPEEQQDE